MGGKGGKSQEVGGAYIVYAHHYAPHNQSELSQASIINFFPFPEKLLFVFPNSYVVAMTRVIHPFDYPSVSPCTCLLNVNDSSMSTLSQRATESRGDGTTV